MNNKISECPICFDNKLLICLNCKHYICAEDLKKILKMNSLCPICRRNIFSDANEKINILTCIWLTNNELISAFDFI